MKIKNIEKKISYFIKRITEYPLKELDDSLTSANVNNLIPNNVYQTWENKFFGKNHLKEIQNFRNLNQNLNFYLYDKKNRDDYMKDSWQNSEIYNIYQKAKFGQIKADIFRYCILYERGGYYFDISKGCKVPLTELHQSNSEVLICNEPIFSTSPPNHKVFNLLKYPFNNFLQWGLGFKKNHKLLKMMIDAIIEDYPNYVDKSFHMPKMAILNLTGTNQFTKKTREYLEIYGVEKVIQAGIYFNEKGIFSMKGSRVRHHLVKEYADLRNMPIFD